MLTSLNSSTSCIQSDGIRMEEMVVPPRRKRASAPRVRTGCKTCKIRRVKCDEGKPSCNRCIKFGISCDGYGTKKTNNSPSASTSTRRLIPKATTFPVRASPSQNLFDFDNPEEWTYFQRFCSYTVDRLSGLRESEFWSRVVLQATQAEPSIRYAATAIGALDLKSFTAAGDEESLKLRRQFAYKEYQKAVVGIRKALTAKDCDIRTRLIACILFACFEAYHGNCEMALVQIFSGIEMMEEHTKKRRNESCSIATRPLPLDPELVQAFAVLEIQACAWGDKRSGDIHLERMYNCAAIVEHGMPFEFSGIKQAGFMLSMNMMRGIHLRFSQTNSAAKCPATIVPPFVGLDSCVNEAAVHELNRCLASFKQWSAAFEPLYRKSRNLQGEKMFEAATMLRMHYLGSVAWVASGSPSIGMYYRRYTKELKEILALGKILVDSTDTQTFSLDMRFVLPLAVVGLNYRHRALRQECIKILMPMFRREAIWDASMMAMIMKFQAEIEEEGLGDEEEYVPEDGMSTIVHLKVNEELRTVFITCSVGIRGHPGKAVLKKTEMTWRGSV